MMRIFTSEVLKKGMIYKLNESDSHHLKNVLRIKVGAKVSIVDASESEFIASVECIEGKRVSVILESKEEINREPKLKVTIFQGLPKGDKMETVIMRATEIGASAFVPVTMKRSVVVLKDSKAKKKRERWQKIAESAASQAKRQIIPEVKPVHSFSQMLGSLKNYDSVFILYENEDRKSVYDLELGNLTGSIAVIVGPEGGFEDSEINFLDKVGVECITLGPRILRTETAALNFISVLFYCSGDMRRSSK